MLARRPSPLLRSCTSPRARSLVNARRVALRDIPASSAISSMLATNTVPPRRVAQYSSASAQTRSLAPPVPRHRCSPNPSPQRHAAASAACRPLLMFVRSMRPIVHPHHWVSIAAAHLVNAALAHCTTTLRTILDVAAVLRPVTIKTVPATGTAFDLGLSPRCEVE
jgi:hypothetical protein